jgi:hypothetical protein
MAGSDRPTDAATAAETGRPTDATTAPSLPVVKTLALDRTSKDTQAANNGARAAAQSAILINGGAATAILAYMSKESYTEPSILSAASGSLIAYALGVLFGAVSMWCASQALGQFALSWEMVLYDMKTKQVEYRTSGETWLRYHIGSFALSILFFFIATCVIAAGFFCRR